MKLTRSSVLAAAGIALVIGLFTWAWVATDRHHSNPVHMGYAVQQMHDGMPNGAMPMFGMRMDDRDMAAMHEAMLGGSTPVAQMTMTATHIRHMESMGMGSMGMGAGVDANAGHARHHPQGR